MVNMSRLILAGVLGLAFSAGGAFAQNIQTDTTSTTMGSSQFGFVITASQLQTVMQAVNTPDCGAGRNPVTNLMVCSGFNTGASNDFERINALPGALTDSPFGVVDTVPNFACGATVDSFACFSLFENAFDQQGAQTAPNSTGFDLIGNINTDIDLGGAGTAGMPEGFIRFTLNPTGGFPPFGSATIDQFIDHTIDMGGGNDMVFQQRDATIGYNQPIPVIGGALSLVPFSISPSHQRNAVPDQTGMVSRMIIAQGPADGFGALDLDLTVNFPAGNFAGTDFPADSNGGSTGLGTFVTPGLNTGIDSGIVPGVDTIGFP